VFRDPLAFCNCLKALQEKLLVVNRFCVGINFIFNIRPSDVAGCSAGVICEITKKKS